MTDVFDTDNKEPTETVLDQLVGEGKKFATAEELAQGKLESDKFIPQLEGENKELREKLEELSANANSADKMQELIELVKTSKQPSGDSNQSEITEDQLQIMVSKLMDAENLKTTRDENRILANALVLDATESVEAAKAFVVDKAKALGIAPGDIARIGESSVKAFAALMGLEQKNTSNNQSTSTSVSDVNTEAFDSNNPSGIRNNKYYQELRRKDVIKFLGSKSIQQQMFKDREDLGDKFFD